ncbi:MAG TPA: hypothetical protein VGL56_07310 [Fimbriimonadaceae bacterium]|jgi:hypothetical protein
MKQITETEAREWLLSKGYRPDATELGGRVEATHDVLLSPDFTKQIFLSRLVRSLVEGGETLFAAVDIGIWPSAENKFVFERYIGSEGLNFDLGPGVFLLAGPGDEDFLEGIVYLSILFIYGAFVARDDGNLIVGWSHDEFIYVNGDPSTCEKAFAELKGYGR